VNKLYLFGYFISLCTGEVQSKQPIKAKKAMDEIRRLERTTEQMIDLLTKIKAENNALKNKLEELTSEKSLLMQKNDQAKTRLESMISRLKTLEQTA
jgi:cell division protein ZapB